MVNPPQKPTAPKEYAVELKNWVEIAPIIKPSRRLPVTLTASVLHGKASPKNRDTSVMIRYRTTPPKAEPRAT